MPVRTFPVGSPFIAVFIAVTLLVVSGVPSSGAAAASVSAVFTAASPPSFYAPSARSQLRGMKIDDLIDLGDLSPVTVPEDPPATQTPEPDPAESSPGTGQPEPDREPDHGSSPEPSSPEAGGDPVCGYQLSPAVATSSSGGGAIEIAVSSPSRCSWSAVSEASWIRVTDGGGGAGTGAVVVDVAPNLESASRNGLVRVGPATMSIIQAGSAGGDGCTYAVYPTSLEVDAGNGAAAVAVTTLAGCAWQAESAVEFIHVTSSRDGSGSGTVALGIENNTALESRPGVVMVAGRAVTVTQAGRGPVESPCRFDLAPGAVNLDAGGGTFTITTDTSPECDWSVASASDFIELATPETAVGAGVATFLVQPNWSEGPRAGLVTIAGHPITVSQRGRTMTEPCVFALSATTAEVSHVGGRVAVALSTDAGCAWDVVLNSSWMHIIEMTPTVGFGTVWIGVEGNSEGERTATIAIGGQAFTLTQAALPISVAASDIRWTSVPDPERAGECWGNCGAGCGTFANPCGGEHRWQHELLTEPKYVEDDWIPMCAGDASWWEVRPRYTALARWTFVGLKSRSCEEHDETCRNLDFIPHLPADKLACTLTALLVLLNGSYCEGARRFEWSYDLVDVGHGAVVAYVDGGAPCQ